VWVSEGRGRRTEVGAGVQAGGKDQSRLLCFKRTQCEYLCFLESAKR